MTVRLEPYRPEQAGAVSAFRALFPLHDRQRPAAYYSWKYAPSPAGAAEAWLAWEGEQVVGLHAWLPRTARLRGRRITLAEFQDTYTHPAHQGEGIFTGLTDRLARQAAGRCDGAFVVPNRTARPLWESKFGYREALVLVDLRWNFRSLGRRIARHVGLSDPGAWCREFAGAALPDARIGDWEFRTAPDDLPEPAALFDPDCAGVSLRFERSADWIRWRHRLNPLPHAVLEIARDGPPAAAMAVLPTEAEGYHRLYVQDLGCTGGEGLRRELARAIVEWAAQSGTDELRLILPEGDPWLAPCREAGGAADGPGHPVMISPELQRQLGPGADARRWWMRGGDTGDL